MFDNTPFVFCYTDNDEDNQYYDDDYEPIVFCADDDSFDYEALEML